MRNKQQNKKSSMEFIQPEEVERRLQIHLLRASVEDELKKNNNNNEKISTNKLPYATNNNDKQAIEIEDEDEPTEQTELTRQPYGKPAQRVPMKQKMSITAIQNIFRNTKAQWDTDYLIQGDSAGAGKDDEDNNHNDNIRLSIRNNNVQAVKNNEQQ